MLTRIYYAFLPEDFDRPGGVWWYKTLTDREAAEWITNLLPVVHHLRIAHEFPEHDPLKIKPPKDAKVLK